MFIVKNQKCLLNGLGIQEGGTFTAEDGREIPFDGYFRVDLMIPNKNGKLQEIKCRIANTTEGEALYKKLAEISVGTYIFVDVEIQLSSKNVSKIFISNFTESK